MSSLLAEALVQVKGLVVAAKKNVKINSECNNFALP
jgi:hypothetical protein